MVSRFAKPQIGQTSSDSKMGVFTAFFGVKLRGLFSVSRREG